MKLKFDMKKFYRITYQWPPGSRGATQATVAIEDVGTKAEQKNNVIQKLNGHIGQTVHVLDCYKLPSNYKAQESDMIE